MNRERVFDLLDRHAAGTWTAEEKQELEVYLLNSPEVQGWFWEHARLLALLREACQREAGREMANVDAASDDSATGSAAANLECSLGPSAALPILGQGDAPLDADQRSTHPLGLIGDLFSTGSGFFAFGSLGFFALLVGAMLTGSVLTLWFVNGRTSNQLDGSLLAKSPEAVDGRNTPAMATLVNVTNCRWDPTRSTADVRSGTIRPGQSLNLLEGVAEVNSNLPGGGYGRFQLEGPLSMILTSEGMPNLHYGKLTAEIACEYDHYILDTPMGRITVPYEASIGLIANANDLELHVFDGEAIFEPLWPIGAADTSLAGEPVSGVDVAEQLVASAGTSIRIDVSVEAGQKVRRSRADRKLFASQVSMASNRLEISQEYVAAIRRAAPLCYWRFEQAFDGVVPNEMGERFGCRVEGEGIHWRTYRGNRAIGLGSTADAGYLVSEDSFDGLIDTDYTLETWIKPSHFHRGALFSLITEAPTRSQPVGTGMMLELLGTSYNWQSLYPGRLRFLHRNPPGEGAGVSCYSESAYELRKWQHVAAMKQGAEMRLYLNSRLVASSRDSSKMANGLRVLIGQLYPLDERRGVIARPYMGELDETAFYARALSTDEIAEHIRLAQPSAELPQSDAKADGRKAVGKESRPTVDRKAIKIIRGVNLKTAGLIPHS